MGHIDEVQIVNMRYIALNTSQLLIGNIAMINGFRDVTLTTDIANYVI